MAALRRSLELTRQSQRREACARMTILFRHRYLLPLFVTGFAYVRLIPARRRYARANMSSLMPFQSAHYYRAFSIAAGTEQADGR